MQMQVQFHVTDPLSTKPLLETGRYMPGYPYRNFILFLNIILALINKEPGSSVSIVSAYGLNDRAIQVRSPAGAEDFSSNLSVQTGSGAHPDSCTMGTGGPFPGGKTRTGRHTDHSPPSSAEAVKE
jgi:hypothetical protein